VPVAVTLKVADLPRQTAWLVGCALMVVAIGGDGGRVVAQVDGEDVPVPHFGIVLPMEQWKALARRLEDAGTEFVIAPTIRFEGQLGEQATMFFLDPAGNALEFKAMANPANLFAKN